MLSFIRVNNKENMKKLLERTKGNEIIKEMDKKMKDFKSKKYVQKYWIEEVMRRTEIESGFNNGKTVGFNESKYEIAKNLIKNNVKTNIITSSTGLSLNEVNKLKNKVKKLTKK